MLSFKAWWERKKKLLGRFCLMEYIISSVSQTLDLLKSIWALFGILTTFYSVWGVSGLELTGAHLLCCTWLLSYQFTLPFYFWDMPHVISGLLSRMFVCPRYYLLLCLAHALLGGRTDLNVTDLWSRKPLQWPSGSETPHQLHGVTKHQTPAVDTIGSFLSLHVSQRKFVGVCLLWWARLTAELDCHALSGVLNTGDIIVIPISAE